MEWRVRWDIDRLLTHWEPPLVLKQFFPSGVCGTDKDGVPGNPENSSQILSGLMCEFLFAVIMVPFCGLDIWGLLHAVSKADFIRMTARSIEKYLAEASENLAKEGKAPCAPTLIAIMDMDHFSIKPYTWRPGMILINSLSVQIDRTKRKISLILVTNKKFDHGYRSK